MRAVGGWPYGTVRDAKGTDYDTWGLVRSGSESQRREASCRGRPRDWGPSVCAVVEYVLWYWLLGFMEEGYKADGLRYVVGSWTPSTSPRAMSSLVVMLVVAAGLLLLAMLSSLMTKWHAHVADVGRVEEARGAELRWVVARRGKGGDRGSGLWAYVCR